MKLVSVLSAAKTAIDGYIDLSLTADLTAPADGEAANTETLPFTWHRDDTHGLAPQVTAWMDAHPDFTISDYVAPAGTNTQVDAERERRIALPLTVTLSDGTSFDINMDALAQRNLSGLASVGQYMVATSSTDTVSFRDYDNTDHDLTGPELVSIGLQVAARIEAMYQKAWALKALDPIPSDYTADSYWT